MRTDVPFKDLTPKERDIVFHGPAVKKNIIYQNHATGAAGDMDFTYFNATYTVKNALSRAKDDKALKRIEKFLTTAVCPDCHGTRLSEAARAPRLRGIGLDEACTMTLEDSVEWVRDVPGTLPEHMRPMAASICESYMDVARRLLDLGLGYLALDRAASTLSTGERQRMQLARAVRNRTTGVLYVLDEPSIGLHPKNIEGLTGVMDDLVADGNTVVLVDHDVQILKHADWMVEMGPGAGADGGRVITQGTVADVAHDGNSVIAPYLADAPQPRQRPVVPPADMFAHGEVRMTTSYIHTVKPLDVRFPKGRLSVVTGMSGSGKTTMVLESLVPALQASIDGTSLPAHVTSIESGSIGQVKLIDATPIGINIRSTVATYANVHDQLRRVFASTDAAKRDGLKAGAFSYNTGDLRCHTCDGTGTVSLDVQFLPDVEITCPDCNGTRYGAKASTIKWTNKAGASYSLPGLMAMSVDEAIEACAGLPSVLRRLRTLHDLGLGYLTLGEETPGLSGGEAQRLKLASEMGRPQGDSLFVFDEPTIGLHPRDVATLLTVFQTLIDQGATVIVIEHDLDVIRNADWIVDMGPGGGEDGGTVVVAGTVDDVRACPRSATGRFI